MQDCQRKNFVQIVETEKILENLKVLFSILNQIFIAQLLRRFINNLEDENISNTFLSLGAANIGLSALLLHELSIYLFIGEAFIAKDVTQLSSILKYLTPNPMQYPIIYMHI